MEKTMSRGEPLGENMEFVNNFWGQNDRGFQTIKNRINDSLTTLQEVMGYYQERIAIEKEYNKKLAKLNGKINLGSSETGSLKRSLDKLQYENQQMVNYNQKFIKSVSQINYEKLYRFYEVFHKKVSKIDSHMTKVNNRRNDALKALETAKSKYQMDSAQIKSLTLMTQTTWGKELEKNQVKLDKMRSSLSSTRKHYEAAVAHYQNISHAYNRDWSRALSDFYMIDLERIQTCKINCFNFCNNIATLCVDNDRSVDLARSVFAKIQPPADLQNFSDNYGTGNKIYNPPDFVDFMNGMDEPEGPGYVIADFDSPDYAPVLSRSYSTYSSATQEMKHNASPVVPEAHLVSDTFKTPNASPTKRLPHVSLPPPGSMPESDSPTRRAPVPFETNNLKAPKTTGSVYSSSPEDNKNEIFSEPEIGSDYAHKFKNSNGSSNYSNPTAYSSSNDSAASNGERTWASPRRKQQQLNQFQEQINRKSKEMASLPQGAITSEPNKSDVPITKDFSIDFIAKALEDLNSGGNGDINRFRKSMRKSSPPDIKPEPSYFAIDDHNEVATKYDKYSSEPRNTSPRAAKPRPKSMFQPIVSDDMGYQEDSQSTCIFRESRHRSLSKSPSKSYTNLHSLINKSPLTPISHKPFISKARARYTYKPSQRGELFFKKGWNMYIIHKQEDNWFFCELGSNCNDRVGLLGLVPGNYLVEGDDLF